MTAHAWGAHAPSRAGDDVLVIANLLFFFGSYANSLLEDCFGEGAETSTRAACSPRITSTAQMSLTR